MRKFLLLAFSCFLLGCNKYEPNTLVIGTVAGPETELVEAARSIAHEKYGLTIKIVEFNDYNLPNEALEDGSLDANIYQHQAYLDAAIEAHGYHLQTLGKTFIYPMGIYSEKYQSLDKLPENARIAIPNDPSNEARALRLLADAGTIQLKNKSLNSDLQDIVKNPRHFQFQLLDAASLPRILKDVDAAVINSNYALPAGLKPSEDALFLESTDSPYANLIVIRKDSKKRKQLEDFVKALHSDKVKAKAKERFGNAAIPAWQ